MFSSRVPWSFQPNRLAALLLKLHESGMPILDLTESNPTHAGLSYPAEEILAALADPHALKYEPSPEGLLSAREAVSGYYRARGCAVEPGRILLTSSTSEAYAFLFKLLCDPSDEVLVPRPSYPLFEYLAALESVHPVSYPLNYTGQWSVDLEALERAITPRTRAVVLVNPNNPTGSFIKEAEVAQLMALCRQRELAIISDEVFSDYTFDGAAKEIKRTLVDVNEGLVFCLSGLSKIAGLPQMKAGWIVSAGSPSSDVAQAARQRLELIADTYLSVSAPIQHALPTLLDLGSRVQVQIQERVRFNLQVLRGAIAADSPARVLNVEGGWYATLEVPRTRTEEEWCLELLEQDSVLVQPGFFYDFESEAFLVMSLLTYPEIFHAGVRRLLARVAS